MLDFIFPEIPEWLKAKKIIESKVKGDIRKIDVQWMFLSYDLKNKIKSWKTDVSQGGGALSYFFSHVLYYLEYFVGKIKNIECQLSSSEKSLNKGETEVLMNVLFENGCIGNIHMNIASTDRQKHSIEFFQLSKARLIIPLILWTIETLGFFLTKESASSNASLNILF